MTCPPLGVHELGERAVVAHVAVGPRILEQDREGPGLGRVGRGADHDLDRERLRPRQHDVDRLREDIVGHEEPVAFAVPDAVAQRHRLGRRRRFIQHRRVGDRHRGQVADHRLEVDQRLQPSLRDLGLVRRVGGVPGGILEDVAQNDARRVRAVVALADERLQHLVPARDRPHSGQRLRLGHGARQRERRLAPDRGGHDRVHQRSARGIAQDFEHRRLILRRGADVPSGKGVGLFERRQRCRGGNAGGRGIVHGLSFRVGARRGDPRARKIGRLRVRRRRSSLRRPAHRGAWRPRRRPPAATGTARRRTDPDSPARGRRPPPR